MKLLRDEINWKGIGDYLSAARTLTAHGSSNTSGPRTHCQGLALELALKLHLWHTKGAYPGIHDLERLATKHCADIQFSAEELALIKLLNRQYHQDGRELYPARYRPAGGSIVVSVAQPALEGLVASVVRRTSRADLVQRMLAR